MKKPAKSAAAPGAGKRTAVIERDNSAGVDALLAGMAHPLTSTVEAIRATILAAHPRITEGIKWNSPSFYCQGWFATVGSRKPERVDVVLHHGAQVRLDSSVRDRVDDAAHLLTWSSPDRALVSFTSAADFDAKESAFRRIIAQWADYQLLLADSPA
jgi:hypothetical protein